MTTFQKTRWYDAEIARMMLQTANANCAVRARPRSGDPYQLTIACLSCLGLFAGFNLPF